MEILFINKNVQINSKKACKGTRLEEEAMEKSVEQLFIEEFEELNEIPTH